LGANFFETNLSGAILVDAKVNDATRRGAVLRGTLYEDIIFPKGFSQESSYLELTITDNIQTEDLTKLLSTLNRLHTNLSRTGEPLEIESVKIGIPDFEYAPTEDWL
jgi:uncharacterized protein YjbI with pentapeptide repeats